jgi:hypothetical protein
MSQELVAVHCPRCGGAVHRFGHDPSSKRQRYRCKSVTCRRQLCRAVLLAPASILGFTALAVVPPWASSRFCPMAGAFAVIAIAPEETAIALTKSTCSVRPIEFRLGGQPPAGSASLPARFKPSSVGRACDSPHHGGAGSLLLLFAGLARSFRGSHRTRPVPHPGLS